MYKLAHIEHDLQENIEQSKVHI